MSNNTLDASDPDSINAAADIVKIHSRLKQVPNCIHKLTPLAYVRLKSITMLHNCILMGASPVNEKPNTLLTAQLAVE